MKKQATKKERMEALLKKELEKHYQRPVVDLRISYVTGWWRTHNPGVMPWEAYGRVLNEPESAGITLSIEGWSTLTECLKYGFRMVPEKRIGVGWGIDPYGWEIDDERQFVKKSEPDPGSLVVKTGQLRRKTT